MDIDFLKVTYLDKFIFCLKLFVFLILTFLLILLKIFCHPFSKKLSYKLIQFFHKTVLWLINIKVKVLGKPRFDAKGVLYVCNHLSYVDISVLGSFIPGKFIAKSEISNWPLIGFLSKIGNTIFINRNLSYLKKNKTLVKDQIINGENILLFPEGTTSDGNRILNFKSSMFFSLDKEDITIQPIVLKYRSLNGLPFNRNVKPIIAWYGDMDFKTHLLNLIKLFSISVTIIFLKPIKSINYQSRKDMTFELQNVIDTNYSSNLDI